MLVTYQLSIQSLFEYIRKQEFNVATQPQSLLGLF